MQRLTLCKVGILDFDNTDIDFLPDGVKIVDTVRPTIYSQFDIDNIDKYICTVLFDDEMTRLTDVEDVLDFDLLEQISIMSSYADNDAEGKTLLSCLEYLYAVDNCGALSDCVKEMTRITISGVAQKLKCNEDTVRSLLSNLLSNTDIQEFISQVEGVPHFVKAITILDETFEELVNTEKVLENLGYEVEKMSYTDDDEFNVYLIKGNFSLLPILKKLSSSFGVVNSLVLDADNSVKTIIDGSVNKLSSITKTDILDSLNEYFSDENIRDYNGDYNSVKLTLPDGLKVFNEITHTDIASCIMQDNDFMHSVGELKYNKYIQDMYESFITEDETL